LGRRLGGPQNWYRCYGEMKKFAPTARLVIRILSNKKKKESKNYTSKKYEIQNLMFF
jgi:hypothetical protein